MRALCGIPSASRSGHSFDRFRLSHLSSAQQEIIPCVIPVLTLHYHGHLTFTPSVGEAPGHLDHFAQAEERRALPTNSFS